MFGQPSTKAVLNPGLVPGVASIETAGVHAPYGWAFARERSVPSPTARGVVESQETAARVAARAPQRDRIAFLVNILHLHERGYGGSSLLRQRRERAMFGHACSRRRRARAGSDARRATP